ncbi:MAG: hypothetical protein JNN03_06995 [Rubrivivax sp.]|nr:hypothetical protein [Rubrivivax sp.]
MRTALITPSAASTFLALGPLLFLAACASEPAPGTPDAKVVCTTEAPTGSNLKVRRCWTEEQTALQQQDARAVGEATSRVRPAAERR